MVPGTRYQVLHKYSMSGNNRNAHTPVDSKYIPVGSNDSTGNIDLFI